jgi:hypothetical protein
MDCYRPRGWRTRQILFASPLHRKQDIRNMRPPARAIMFAGVGMKIGFSRRLYRGPNWIYNLAGPTELASNDGVYIIMAEPHPCSMSAS